MNKSTLSFFEAIAILVGTIIGAGIYGIPYVVAQSGFMTGLVLLLVIAAAILINNLLLGEVILSTKGDHQLTGYVEKYLGAKGKYAMLLLLILSFYGALLSYLIAQGQILAAIFGGSPFIYSLIFFMAGALLIYFGLTVIKRVEFVMTMVVLAIVVFITFFSFGHVNWENLQGFDLSKMLLPYGVIFFAMGGFSALPLMRQVLYRQEKKFKKAIIIGVLIPVIVYAIFALIVVGVTGGQTTEIATIGLGQALGPVMIIFGNVFAFFTMGTSFLTIGQALSETYSLDLKLPSLRTWILTVTVPLLFFLSGVDSFVLILGLVGAIGGGLEGLLILITYLKLKSLKTPERTPEFKNALGRSLVIFVGLAYIAGIIYTLWHL